MVSSVDLALSATARQATLTLQGEIRGVDARAAARVCLALPREFKFLRIDARYADELHEEGAVAVRSLVRDWRRQRSGQVMLLVEPQSLASLAMSPVGAP